MTKKSNLGNEISIDTKVLVFYMYLKHINRILYVVIRQWLVKVAMVAQHMIILFDGL